MPDKIFEFTVVKSQGGKSSRDTFSNRYDIALNDDVSSDNMRENAFWLVGGELLASLSEVYFQRVHIKQRADNVLNAPDRSRFKTVVLDARGARAVNFTISEGGQIVNPMMPIDTCVVLRRDTDEGRAGKLLYRGCLLRSDVALGADGVWTLAVTAPFTALATRLSLPPGDPDGLPHGQFVIPNKVDTVIENVIAQTSRPVSSFKLAGVQTLDRNRQKKSLQQVEKMAAQRQLTAYESQIKKLLQGKTPGELLGSALQIYTTIRGVAQAYYAALPVAEQAAIALPALLA